MPNNIPDQDILTSLDEQTAEDTQVLIEMMQRISGRKSRFQSLTQHLHE